MNSLDVHIENIDSITFNNKYDTVIDRNMTLYSVLRQLERIPSIMCGYVSTTEKRALETVLKSMNEYIINIENVFYLCVRDVTFLEEAKHE